MTTFITGLTNRASEAFSNMFQSEISQRATQYVSNAGSDARAGVIGGILGAVVGFFTLPFFVPTVLPMAGGAYLGFQGNRTVRHIQQEGVGSFSARVKETILNLITQAGQGVVKAVESGYHYVSNIGHTPFNYADLDEPSEPESPAAPISHAQETEQYHDEYSSPPLSSTSPFYEESDLNTQPEIYFQRKNDPSFTPADRMPGYKAFEPSFSPLSDTSLPKFGYLSEYEGQQNKQEISSSRPIKLQAPVFEEEDDIFGPGPKEDETRVVKDPIFGGTMEERFSNGKWVALPDSTK
ncbi:MAG: DUF456 domain-containing protein [Simkania negevensis]|nr:DUF456 domain-containing protein [Simkania negevensis]